MFSLAYLLSASPDGAILAHVAMHIGAVVYAYGTSIPCHRITEQQSPRLERAAGAPDTGAGILIAALRTMEKQKLRR